MDRRRFLAVLAAGLGGCSAFGGGGTDPGTDDATPTGTASATATPTPTATRSAEDPTTTETDDGDEEDSEDSDTEDDDSPTFVRTAFAVGDRTLVVPPYARGIEWNGLDLSFVATATAEGPARLRATLRNDGGTAETVALGDVPLFAHDTGAGVATFHRDPEWADPATSGRDPPALLFPPAPGHDLLDAAVSVERGPAGFWRLAAEPTVEGPDSVSLDPGEAIAGEHLVVRPPGAEGFPTGRYERDLEVPEPPTVTAWQTSAPGPTALSRFDGTDLPGLTEEGPTFYHEAGPDTDAYLAPETERARLPATLRFTLRNHGPITLEGGHAGLYKLHGGRWHFVDGRLTDPAFACFPGSTLTWNFEASSDVPDSRPPDVNGTGAEVGLLGGGRYAWGDPYRFSDPLTGEVPADVDATVAPFAVVDLVAPALSVTPTADATAERDGATVRVRTTAAADAERMTLRRADWAMETLIAERVMRVGPLRNTLSFFAPDVERVVLETDSVRYALDYATSRRFRFRGEAFEVVRGDTTA